jgi:GNAT superfamily N-acetyltransferase
MSSDGHACAMWLPPGGRTGPSGFVEHLRLLPFYLRVFGFARLGRCASIVAAMDKNHPTERHFYLAFMAVSPRYQGTGLGSAILGTTLKRVDDAGAAAYLENSNPKNARLYERAGFVAQDNISPNGAPPLVAMWRPAHVS